MASSGVRRLKMMKTMKSIKLPPGKKGKSSGGGYGKKSTRLQTKK